MTKREAVNSIADLLPNTVSTCEAHGDLPVANLPAVEAAAVAAATPARQAEFATTRACAHAALTGLCHQPTPIPAGPTGAPIWPKGIVGSLTHTSGYRAAAVAHHSDITSLGIDAEPHRHLPAGVLDLITDPRERSDLHGLHEDEPTVAWDRLIFSCKETAYKAWWPLLYRNITISAVRVTLDPHMGRFIARGPVPSLELNGRWSVGSSWILTAATT